MKQILDETAIQGSIEWLNARFGFRNASETPDVMGVGFNTPNKLKRIKAGLETVFVNSAMKRGNDLEDQVREWAEEKLNEMFSASVWENGKYRASLDGLNFSQDTLIEIKVSDYSFNKIVVEEEIPYNYQLQMQHQMYCSPATKGYLVVYSPTVDDYVISEPLEFDSDLWETIQTAWAEFDAMEVPEEEYVEIEDERYEELDYMYARVKRTIDILNSDIEEVKAEMMLIAKGRNIKAEFTSIKFSTRKGNVNYAKILKENNIKVDLNKYRAKSSDVSTIRINKDNETE